MSENRRNLQFNPRETRRVAMYDLQISSPVMIRRLDVYGGQIVAAFIRVGTLVMFTKNDPVAAEKVKDWIRECLQDFKADHEKINTYMSESKVSSGVTSFISGFNQQPVSFNMPINHPIANSYIDCIRDVDTQQLELERLYFSGVFDEKQFEMAQKQAVRPFNHMIDRIYNVTNVTKRNGGTFDPREFLDLLKNEESISAMFNKYMQAKKKDVSKLESETSELVE